MGSPRRANSFASSGWRRDDSVCRSTSACGRHQRITSCADPRASRIPASRLCATGWSTRSPDRSGCAARNRACGEIICDRSRALANSGPCDNSPVLSDYGMQPLSGTEYGGMLSDLVRVPYAEPMLAPVAPDLDSVALASVSDNVLDGYRAVAPHLAQLPGAEVLIVSHGLKSVPLYAAQTAVA